MRASVKGTKQLYVTDQRILLHEIKGIVTNDETSIPLPSISSINISNKLVYSTIEIASTGNIAIIDDVPAHIALEIKSGIEKNLKVMAKTASAPAAKQEKDMYDIGDEIREMMGY